MLHHARKAVNKTDCSIYGIATDSFAWTFLYLNDDGKVGLQVMIFHLLVS